MGAMHDKPFLGQVERQQFKLVGFVIRNQYGHTHIGCPFPL
jgi:hypothetical protein